MERQQFEIEAKRMRPALLRLASRYMEDADEAEDVIQDVLLKLWFLREKLDRYRSVDALAMVITKHLCINQLRKSKAEFVDLEQSIGMDSGEAADKSLLESEEMEEDANNPPLRINDLETKKQSALQFISTSYSTNQQ